MPTFGSGSRILRSLELSHDWDELDKEDEQWYDEHWHDQCTNIAHEPETSEPSQPETATPTALAVVQRRLETSPNECSICLDDTVTLRTLGCKHKFCDDCLAAHVHAQAADVANVVHRVAAVRVHSPIELSIGYEYRCTVRCPAFHCTALLPQATFQAVAAPADANRCQELATQRIADLQAMMERDEVTLTIDMHPPPGLKRGSDGSRKCDYCGDYNVWPVAKKGPGERRLRCRTCFVPYCAKCEEDHPRSERCDGMPHQRAGRSRTSTTRAFVKWLQSNLKAFDGIKLCPNCKTVIQKNGGCPHMHCTHCKTHFQWTSAPQLLLQKRRIAWTGGNSRKKWIRI